MDKPIRSIQSFSPSIGSIYSLYYQKPSKPYLATNQGLYSGFFSLQDNSLDNIQIDPVIKGQVWDISGFDNQLFCGNNEETYEIHPKRKIISLSKGGMCIARGIIHGREVLVQGTYSDICTYTKENGTWQFNSNVQGFLNPEKNIVVDYQGRI
ncbi:MAG: hypothetical protein ACK5KP_05620 [Paludibacteraceae bacterium]